MPQELPKGAVVHRQGYRDPIDGTLRLAVTACGTQLEQAKKDGKGRTATPGTVVTDDPKKLTCEPCKKAPK